jgi:epoxyqueuosine reductase QueG
MVKGNLSKDIRNLARLSGIDALGFAKAYEFKDYALRRSKRRDPSLSLPNAKTIIIAGIYIGSFTLPSWENLFYGRTSRLYLSGYFNDVVKPLGPIVERLKNEGYHVRICDESRDGGSILPLKLAAIRAGFGWQGKHSLLISKKYGTFLALGGLITDADLGAEIREEANRCLSCDKCQKACPLGALDQPYVLNRKKCLSHHLLSEYLPEKAQAVMANRIQDCEICQLSCPWNRKHLEHPLETAASESFQHNIGDFEDLFYLPKLVKMSHKGYANTFDRLNTGISYDIFHRNVSIAMEKAKRSGEVMDR